MLENCDAALLIGDPALRVAFAAEPKSIRDTTGAVICKGSHLGIPGADTLYIYDIVAEWRALTGLPAVLAVWATRREFVTGELVQDFQSSLQFGLAPDRRQSARNAPHPWVCPLPIYVAICKRTFISVSTEKICRVCGSITLLPKNWA